jgi:hypothetical protein
MPSSPFTAPLTWDTFPTASSEDWVQLILKENPDFTLEKLKTLLPEGIMLEPFYAIDPAAIQQIWPNPEEYNFVRNLDAASVMCLQKFSGTELDLIQEAYASGLRFAAITGEWNPSLMTQFPDILWDLTSTIHLEQILVSNPLQGIANLNPDTTRFSIDFPPFFSPYQIDFTHWQYQGANRVQALTAGFWQLNQWVESALNLGKSSTDFFPRLCFRIAVDTEILPMISMVRAFRSLYFRYAISQGISNPAQPLLILEQSASGWSGIDVQTNLLRSAIGALIASLSGADYYIPIPFSTQANRSFTLRIGRNLLHLLQAESYLDKEVDPAGGAVSIETLAWQMKEQTIHQLVSVSEVGNTENLISEISSQRLKTEKAYRTGKLSAIGVNYSPTIERTIPEPPESPAPDFRPAALFETEIRKNWELPPVYLFALTDDLQAQSRGTFVTQFLDTCGIKSTTSEIINKVIIFYGNDESYTTLEELEKNVSLFSNRYWWLVAKPGTLAESFDLSSGFQGYIHLGADRIETCQKIAQQLQVQV